MREKEGHQIFWGALSFFWVMYIYSHSASTAPQSQAQSNSVVRIIIDIAERFFGFVLTAELCENMGRIVRKCAHMAIFFILGALLFVFIMSICKKKRPICALISTAAFAAADEFHQMFTPGRGPSLRDVAIDTFGAMLGIFVLLLIFRKGCFPKKLHGYLPEYRKHRGRKKSEI